MDFRILGPLEVVAGGSPLPLGRRKQRAVLAILLVHANRVVSVDQLVEELWGDEPPARAIGSLQAYVSHLRRLLEPGRPARTPASVVQTRPPGYRLAVAPDDLDAARFEALTAKGRGLLEAGEPAAAAGVLTGGLQLWRGAVLADFPDDPFAQAERARLAELRLVAEEDRAAAQLALGHPATVAAELDRLVAAHPFREGLHGLRMLALYRAPVGRARRWTPTRWWPGRCAPSWASIPARSCGSCSAGSWISHPSWPGYRHPGRYPSDLWFRTNHPRTGSSAGTSNWPRWTGPSPGPAGQCW